MKLPKNPLWPMSPWARFEGDGDGDGGGGSPAVPLVDAEGNLAENWTQHLPEDIRDAECFKLVGNFQEFGKQLHGAQKAIGKNKIALPGPDPTDEELGEFYNQAGRPKTEADYAYTRPEAVPESERSEERMAEIRKEAHENGLSQRQFTQRMKRSDARIVERLRTAEETAIRETDEAERRLKDIWGMAYEERIHVVNRFINETTEEGEQRDAFIKEFGRNPVFVQWAAAVGKKLVESDVLIAELTQKAPKEAQAELDEWRGTDEYQKYIRGEFATSNPSKHKNMLKKETELMKIIHPPKKAG
jgi:hypothetical protein